MQDPASGLPRISLPRTPVNREVKKDRAFTPGTSCLVAQQPYGTMTLMAGAVKPSNVTVYVKPVIVMLCTSSLQLRLGHVNAPVTSPAVILSLIGSITI